MDTTAKKHNKKILILVSGQTRALNENDHFEKFIAGIERVFGDYDYDLAGHTWNDQELPNDLTKFIGVHQTEQSDIVKWVREDFKRRVFFTKKWAKNPLYEKIARNDSDLMKFLLERSVGAYSQLWSFDLSLRLHANKIHEAKYAAIIRYRWDTGPRAVYYDRKDLDKLELKIQQYKQTLYDFIHRDGIWAKHDAKLVCSYPAMFAAKDGCGFIPDHCFWMTPQIAQHLIGEPLGEILDELNEKHVELPTSHGLWAEYLSHTGVRVTAAAPDIHSCIFGKQEDKSNKIWSM